MKTKAALILCVVMCLSVFVSCTNAEDLSSAVNNTESSYLTESEVEISKNEVSKESSEDSSESEKTVVIPENALYFTGTYYFPHYDGSVLRFSPGLNEWHSSGIYGNSLTEIIENGSGDDNNYYYVGIQLVDENITDDEVLESKNENMLKKVGFIPTDEPYLNIAYLDQLDINSITEETLADYAQNLMPNVDLSQYEIQEEYGYVWLLDFYYHYTGYITLDGIKALVDNYDGVVITWLPAPDDRARFLTYLNIQID